MRYLKAYENFSLNEGRVPRGERVELYRDDNIIVVVPLTHRALQKYAHKCQWCINDDLGEWEDYHKGKHVVIIQRKPKKDKIGITGYAIPEEIFLLAKWDNNQSSFEDVCQMLEYEFRNDRTMSDYYVKISNDIDNFATSIVYYSPENGIYDMEDNFLWNFNYEISDIPNVTPEVISIMDEYLTKEDSVMESMQNEISDILSLFDEFKGEVEVKLLRSHYDKNLDNNVNAISIRPTNPFTIHETTMDVNHLSWTLHSENDLLERIIDTCRTLEDEGNWISINVMRCKSKQLSILSDPFNEFWFQENIGGRSGEDVYAVLEYAQKNYPDGFLEITIKWCKK
jgi:hypothetical protein